MAYLRSIHLRGFKTFARPTELLLEPGITVIIGPNGSGKSNLADAILWVLGEQSPSSLRGHSMQDVIFSGPEGRRSSAVAEVSLTFCNNDHAIPLECAEVEVARRLTREGGSEYRVNGVSCRLLDVQDLMSGLGLGREMHSVISQGKVETVLSSTPETRRALIEEAAGLGRFKKRRERARTKLEGTRLNLLRVNDVEREVQSTLRPLRRQALAAQHYSEAVEDWAAARARLLIFEQVSLTNSQKTVEHTLAELTERRRQAEAALADLRRQRAVEEEGFAVALRRREELAAIYHRVQTEADRLETAAVSLRQRLIRNESEQERARRRQEMAEKELASLEAHIRRLDALQSEDGRLRRVDSMARHITAELEKAAPAYQDTLRQEELCKDAVFEAETARSRALQDRDYLRRELEEKRRLRAEMAELGQAARRKVEELERQLAGYREGLAYLAAEGGEAAAALAAAASHRESARENEQQALQEEMRLGQMLVGLDSRREVVEDLLRRREGIAEGARHLLSEEEDSSLLMELLTVEPGYETAAATALGPLAQAVVLRGSPNVSAALRGNGPREVVWSAACLANGDNLVCSTGGAFCNSFQERLRPASEPPLGTIDLWKVISGPADIIETLRLLVRPTAVLLSDGLDSLQTALEEEKGGWVVVARTGEMVTPRLHAARRTEEGIGTLLRAKNELALIAREQAALSAQREQARRQAASAGEAAGTAEASYRQAEQHAREIERKKLGLEHEAERCSRQLSDAKTQVAELEERESREAEIEQRLREQLSEAEALINRCEAQVEESRAQLRIQQQRLESLRQIVGRLEEKKAQAGVVEMRLKERWRARENERQRLLAHQSSTSGEMERHRRRVALTTQYAPVLAELLGVVESLAAAVRCKEQDLEIEVVETKACAEAAARVMRDWGGTEARFQAELDDIAGEQTRLQVEQARLQERLAQLGEELASLRRKHLRPRDITPDDLAGHTLETLQSALLRAEQRKDRMGPINPLAEQQCAELEERARFLVEQRQDLESSVAQLEGIIADLDKHINNSFSQIFTDVKNNFTAVVASVFPGARGELRLSAGSRGQSGQGAEQSGKSSTGVPSTEGSLPGVELSIKFPNKAPRSMSLLSGGEKAMTAIAFLFSLFLARPCPFYILDEVEASLDDVNMRRFLSLIERHRAKTQFIIITHQRQTMEIADTLYGVALEPEGTSRVLSRRLGANKKAKMDAPKQGQQPELGSVAKEA